MTFTVEDGTGVEDANSYVTVQYADDYFTDRGITDWTDDNSAKQSALIKATDYVEQTYSERWKGYPVECDQPLSWPRCGIKGVDTDEIPDRLKQAVCQLALEALSGELNPVLDRATKREKVDVIEVEYMDSALPGKSRPAIDGLLRPYVSGSRYNAPVVRV